MNEKSSNIWSFESFRAYAIKALEKLDNDEPFYYNTYNVEEQWITFAYESLKSAAAEVEYSGANDLIEKGYKSHKRAFYQVLYPGYGYEAMSLEEL